MSTQIPMILTGTILSLSLAQYMQCDYIEQSEARDGDAALGLDEAQATAKLEELGKRVFFDNISDPERMACASCHDPAAGWTNKNAGINLHQVVSTGANPHKTGAVKPPSNAYASKIANFQLCNVGANGVCGGTFWNGRAEGNPVSPIKGAKPTQNVGDEVFENTSLKGSYTKYLGPVADQALNPFPNPDEQNIEIQEVCKHVAASKYAGVFAGAWGEPIDCSDKAYGSKGFKAFEVNYRRIAVALAAWQDSAEVNSFSSKRDIALAADADGKFPLDGLTKEENRGHELFYATFFNPAEDGKFANCALCHSDNPGADDGTEKFQLYADDAYHNIGTPANPELPAPPDIGLQGHTQRPGDLGAQKAPTLRNVDKRPGKGFTKAYTHNGWFKSLETIVHFYNTADVDGATAESFGITRCKTALTAKQAVAANCWPEPEQPNTAIPFLLGDLHLSLADEAALVAYLKTFTDTKTPSPPKPLK